MIQYTITAIFVWLTFSRGKGQLIFSPLVFLHLSWTSGSLPCGGVYYEEFSIEC